MMTRTDPAAAHGVPGGDRATVGGREDDEEDFEDGEERCVCADDGVVRVHGVREDVVEAWGEGKETWCAEERDRRGEGARGHDRVRRWSGTSRRQRERPWNVKMMCGVCVCALVDRVVTRVRGLTEAPSARDRAAAKAKQIRRGVKEVVKALKKETKGVCVIAGDISPIDVITHVPILCEEANVPYVSPCTVRRSSARRG